MNVRYIMALCIAFSGLMLSGCATTLQPVDLIVTDLRLHAATDKAPLENISIAIRDGTIVYIGSEPNMQSAAVINGGDRNATAGLWNSHVHFMRPLDGSQDSAAVHEQLLRYGFTSVLDTGSDLAATLALADAIERGDSIGPRIFMANGSFVFTDATPVYLPGIRLPEIDDPAQADALVGQFMDEGAHGIKIFAGSFMSPTKTIHLPPDVIRAVADATHARGGFLVAHPDDEIGLVNAVENGVDVLAHTAPRAKPLSDRMIATMKNNKVALIPTLKLWSYELRRGNTPEPVVQMVQERAVRQLADYHAAGGEILFGTDVGYMRDFDPRDEYLLMQQAGMDFADILAALTINPAGRFAGESGQLVVGAAADIVIYAGDPSLEITALAEVLYTIRAGRIVYCADSGDPGSPCH